MGRLAESVIRYLRTTPKEQLEKDWEELKKYNESGTLIITQPLFTLTAEEVEEVRQTIVYALDKRTDWIIANAHKLDDYERSVLERLNEKDQKNLKKIYEYQETKIKQCQENNSQK